MKSYKNYISLFAVLAFVLFGAQQALAHCGACNSGAAAVAANHAHDHGKGQDHSHKSDSDCCGKCGGKGKSECSKGKCDSKKSCCGSCGGDKAKSECSKGECSKGKCDSKKSCCGSCGGDKAKSECSKGECSKGKCDLKKSCCGSCGGDKTQSKAEKSGSCCPTPPTASTQEANPDYMGAWLTDFTEAKAIAAATGRPILVNFTGSDWCGWCIKLDDEVFSKNDFKSYAAERLVLFKADFPRRAKLPADTAAQNRRLANQYGIEGYPTVLLVDDKGKVLYRTGYERGGAGNYVKMLSKELASL